MYLELVMCGIVFHNAVYSLQCSEREILADPYFNILIRSLGIPICNAIYLYFAFSFYVSAALAQVVTM